MALTKFHHKTYEMRTVILVVADMVNVVVRKDVYSELRIFQWTWRLPTYFRLPYFF